MISFCSSKGSDHLTNIFTDCTDIRVPLRIWGELLAQETYNAANLTKSIIIHQNLVPARWWGNVASCFERVLNITR